MEKDLGTLDKTTKIGLLKSQGQKKNQNHLEEEKCSGVYLETSGKGGQGEGTNERPKSGGMSSGMSRREMLGTVLAAGVAMHGMGCKEETGAPPRIQNKLSEPVPEGSDPREKSVPIDTDPPKTEPVTPKENETKEKYQRKKIRVLVYRL